MARINPDLMQVDSGGGIGSQNEMDALYYGQVVNGTGKTQAQLDAATNAANVAGMTGQYVDPKTGMVVAQKPAEQVDLKNKAVRPAAPTGFHYTWIGGTTTGSWVMYKDAPTPGGGGFTGGGGGANTPAAGKTTVSVIANGDGTNTVYYSDGTSEITGTKGLTESAKSIVASFLKDAGMESLAGDVWSKWATGGTSDQIIEYIRQSPQYAERFPAMAALNKAGRNISEAAYIAKETSDIEMMKQYGIPDAISGNRKLLGSLIENNVNLVTLQKRLMAAQDTVLSFDPNIVKYGKDVYGLDEGSLMAWALAPEIALPVIEQQAKAIQIGGAALAAGLKLGEITKTEAETLAAAGVTQDVAKQGFTNVAQMGQYKQQLPGLVNPAETLTNEELINAQFAVSPEAILKLQKAKQTKAAEFAQGGQFAATQSGVTGIGSAPSV